MKKHKRKEFSFPILLVMGAGFSLATVLIISFLLATAAYFTKDPTSLIGAFSLLSLVLAGGISSFVTAKVNGEGGSLIGILSAVICAVVILSVGLVWHGGLLPIGAILNVIAFVIVSIAAALLGKHRSARHFHTRYKM